MTLSNLKNAPNLISWQTKESLRESDKPFGMGQQNLKKPSTAIFEKIANAKWSIPAVDKQAFVEEIDAS